MTKEIFRPCTLWGMTFDACKVVALNEERKESEGHHVRVCVSTPHHSNPYDSLCVVLSPRFMPSLEAFQEAITTIAKALNPPIMATEEVLAGLPKDAKLRTGKHSLERNDKGEWGYYDFNEHWEDEADFWVFVSIDASDRISMTDAQKQRTTFASSRYKA
jgi:hypothetical protein